jgi:hypothetical protein
MTSFNRRVYEMLVRLIVFAKTYPQFFGQDTFPGQLMAQIEAAVQKLSEHVTSQTAGEGSVKVATDERKKARAELRGQLEGISRIGKGLGLTEFMIPRDRNDVALVHVGRTWSSLVQQHKQKFLDSRMPADFIEKLDVAVQKLERTYHEQTYSIGTRQSATVKIDQTRTEAFAALKQLDPIMENLLRDNPAALAVWESARRVPRYANAKPEQAQAAAAGKEVA